MDKPQRAARRIRITVSSDVNAGQVHAAMDELFRLNGCTTCGLGGIDLNFLVGDPPPDSVNELPGVTGATFA